MQRLGTMLTRRSGKQRIGRPSFWHEPAETRDRQPRLLPGLMRSVWIEYEFGIDFAVVYTTLASFYHT